MRFLRTITPDNMAVRALPATHAHAPPARRARGPRARTLSHACACACHRQSGWESRARCRSQAPRCSSAARFATSPRQAAKQRRATLIGLKASSSHAWSSRVGNGWARAKMARPSGTLGRPSGGTQACEDAAQLCDAPGAWSHQWPAITLQVGGGEGRCHQDSAYNIVERASRQAASPPRSRCATTAASASRCARAARRWSTRHSIQLAWALTRHSTCALVCGSQLS